MTAALPPPSRHSPGRDLATLPKAHLHLHFTGSMSPATLYELAAEQGVRLPPALRQPPTVGGFDRLNHQHARVVAPPARPGAAPVETTHEVNTAPVIVDPLSPLLRFAPDERGWFRFQRLYDAARACVNSEQALRRIVSEAADADAAEGSVRLEIQVDPTSYAHHVGGITPALEIILDEAVSASMRTGVDVGVIVAASRMRHPLEARTLARLAAKHAGSGPGQVIGFGLSNDERAGDTAAFAPAFKLACAAGLAGVPHGGELCGPEHVAQIYTDLVPDRLGHGVRASEDPALLDRLVDSGVAFEVCPTSNVALGVYPNAGGVPLRALVDAGASVALGADDPLLFGSRLNAQYEIARVVHGFDDDALAELARSSIRASLAAPEKKAVWLSGVDAWLAAEP